jgi:hypothetical protein
VGLVRARGGRRDRSNGSAAPTSTAQSGRQCSVHPMAELGTTQMPQKHPKATRDAIAPQDEQLERLFSYRGVSGANASV